MSIYAIADLHLSFAPDTDKPMDIFGTRWKDHPERIKENNPGYEYLLEGQMLKLKYQ